jgi:hypothetical protein
VTRKRHAPRRKKSSGVLTGMRGGVRRAAHAVVGEPEGRRKKMIYNVVTAILIAAAAVFLLRRFGVLHF